MTLNLNNRPIITVLRQANNAAVGTTLAVQYELQTGRYSTTLDMRIDQALTGYGAARTFLDQLQSKKVAGLNPNSQ